MGKLVGLLLVILIVTFCSSRRTGRGTDFREILRSISAAEDFDNAIKGLDEAEKRAAHSNFTIPNFQNIFYIDADAERQRKLTLALAKPMKAVLQVLKAVLPTSRTERPTEEELTTLATQLSEAFRNAPLDAFKLDAETVETDEYCWACKKNLDVLENILSSAPVFQSTCSYLEKIKTKSISLYCKLKYGDPLDHSQNTNLECGDVHNPNVVANMYDTVFAYKEFAEFFRSEENAITAVKDFALLIDVYSFYQARTSTEFVKKYQDAKSALSKRKVLTAIAYIDMFRYKCAVARRQTDGFVSEFFRTDMYGLHYDSIRDATAFVFLQPYSRIERIIFATEYYAARGTAPYYCPGYEEMVESLEDVISSSDAFVTEEKLAEVRARNELAYHHLYLINELCKTMHRRDGLTYEAMEFFKEVYTVPHVLSRMMLPKYAYERSIERDRTIKRFNGLPVEVRKELIQRFPYRAYHQLLISRELEKKN